MATPIGPSEAIQVDSETDRDTSGILIDNIQRVQIIVGNSP